jgi:hypothetical protein
METKPLIKEFNHVELSCALVFTNEQYQERASMPAKSVSMHVKKQLDKYILKSNFPHHHQAFAKNFSITGEYNLEFNVIAFTNKTTYPLLASVVIDKDYVGNIISGKETRLETEVYLANVDTDELFPAHLCFKKKRSTLIPMSILIELPVDLCNEWYELFSKFYSQKVEGPARAPTDGGPIAPEQLAILPS